MHIEQSDVYRATQFRTPSPNERELGVWVDRLGAGRGSGPGSKLRIIGQFAVVAIESGTGLMHTQRNQGVPVNAGDVIFLTPEDPVTYGPEPDWFSRWVVWNGKEACLWMRHGLLPKQAMVINGAFRTVLSSFFCLVGLMEQEGAVAALQRKSRVTTMVLALAEQINLQQDADLSPARMAERAVSEIRAQYANDQSVAELAETLGISVSHFRRIFKAHTGRSPSQFRTDVRIARAKEHLLQGCSVRTTAQAVGYEDHFYFMRMFKRVTGTTTRAFRENEGQ